MAVLEAAAVDTFVDLALAVVRAVPDSTLSKKMPLAVDVLSKLEMSVKEGLASNVTLGALVDVTMPVAVAVGVGSVDIVTANTIQCNGWIARECSTSMSWTGVTSDTEQEDGEGDVLDGPGSKSISALSYGATVTSSVTVSGTLLSKAIWVCHKSTLIIRNLRAKASS